MRKRTVSRNHFFLGWNDVGYRNPIVSTPNVDRLAAEGVRLEQNYAQAMCTPSRAALLTGMYPYHIGRQVEKTSKYQQNATKHHILDGAYHDAFMLKKPDLKTKSLCHYTRLFDVNVY